MRLTGRCPVKRHARKTVSERIESSGPRSRELGSRWWSRQRRDLSVSTPEHRPTGCRSPDSDQRESSYVAAVQQNGPQLTVQLSDADFIVTNGYGDHFSGFVSADGKVTFTIGDAYYYYYYYGHFDVVERLNPSSALLVKGIVNATSSSTVMSGTLNGSILLTLGTTPPFMRYAASCYSRDHRFEMRRR